MLRRFIFSLFLLVSFGSMHAMTLLHDVDTSSLGQPQHRVIAFEGNHCTIYQAYPKEALATLEQRKLLTQCATALSTTSFLYMGMKAVSNAIANSWNYVTACPVTPRHVSAYIVLSGLSYALARYSWDAYDNVVKLYQRIIAHNTGDSLFASDIPATSLPENNQEIAAINAENPNLIWVRASHHVMAPPAYNGPALVASAPPYDRDAQYQHMYPNLDAPVANIHVPMPSAPHASIIIPAPQPARLECSICLDAINKQSAADNMALPCGHVFHANCIRQIASNPAGRCPVCQTSVRQ